jgi:hypothetical protein
MGFSLSPSVNVTENDYTIGVPQISTSEAAIGGVFRWGPLDRRVLVDQEKTLLRRFLKPTNFNAETWFTAASFLAYSNLLWVSRAGNTAGPSPIMTATVAAANATVTVANTSGLSDKMVVINGSGKIINGAAIASVINSTAFTLTSNASALSNGSASVQFVSSDCTYSAVANVGSVANLSSQTIRNSDDYSAKDGTFDTDVVAVARYPGSPGNSLRMSFCESNVQFSSIVNCAAYGNGASLFIDVDSNVATVTVTTTGSNLTSNVVNTNATNFSGNFQVTDYVQFGNNTSGTQSLKITKINVPTVNANSTVGTATFTIEFEDVLRLSTTQTLANNITRYWEFYDLVDQAPGASQYQLAHGNTAAQDELHVVIIDDKGQFTGIPGSVLETYKNVSRATDAKDVDGSTNYYKNIINHDSEYVWIVNDHVSGFSNTALNLSSIESNTVFTQAFAYGSDGSDEHNTSVGILATAYDLFNRPEEVDVSLIMQGTPVGGTQGGQLANYIIDNICEDRKDCVVFISCQKNDVVNATGYEIDNLLEFRASLRSSSYGFLDSGWKYMYDRYNDLYRWIPLNGDMAGLAARTDQIKDPWWAFAGLNRGQIKNVARLAFNPSKAQRDILFKNDINPCVTFRNQGTVLFGDKTLLGISSSVFSRINVRRLFIEIEKAIATAAKYYLFEFNDPFERAQFRNVVNPYLRSIQGKRGIEDFVFVCDESNNGPEVRNNFTLVGDVYVIPNKVIDWIQLNFNAIRSGVSFSEYINSPPPSSN